MVKGGKAEKWAARSARLSTALRENLKRRKEQARERDLAGRRATGNGRRRKTPIRRCRNPTSAAIRVPIRVAY